MILVLIIAHCIYKALHEIGAQGAEKGRPAARAAAQKVADGYKTRTDPWRTGGHAGKRAAVGVADAALGGVGLAARGAYHGVRHGIPWTARTAREGWRKGNERAEELINDPEQASRYTRRWYDRAHARRWERDAADERRAAEATQAEQDEARQAEYGDEPDWDPPWDDDDPDGSAERAAERVAERFAEAERRRGTTPDDGAGPGPAGSGPRPAPEAAGGDAGGTGTAPQEPPAPQELPDTAQPPPGAPVDRDQRHTEAPAALDTGDPGQPAPPAATGPTTVIDGEGTLTFGPLTPPQTAGVPAGETPTSGATMAGSGPVSGAVGDIIDWESAVEVFRTLAAAADQVYVVADTYLLAVVNQQLPRKNIVEAQNLAQACARLKMSAYGELDRMVRLHGAVAEARAAVGGSAERGSYYTEPGGAALSAGDAAAGLPGIRG